MLGVSADLLIFHTLVSSYINDYLLCYLLNLSPSLIPSLLVGVGVGKVLVRGSLLYLRVQL